MARFIYRVHAIFLHAIIVCISIIKIIGPITFFKLSPTAAVEAGTLFHCHYFLCDLALSKPARTTRRMSMLPSGRGPGVPRVAARRASMEGSLWSLKCLLYPRILKCLKGLVLAGVARNRCAVGRSRSPVLERPREGRGPTAAELCTGRPVLSNVLSSLALRSAMVWRLRASLEAFSALPSARTSLTRNSALPR